MFNDAFQKRYREGFLSEYKWAIYCMFSMTLISHRLKKNVFIDDKWSNSQSNPTVDQPSIKQPEKQKNHT